MREGLRGSLSELFVMLHAAFSPASLAHARTRVIGISDGNSGSLAIGGGRRQSSWAPAENNPKLRPNHNSCELVVSVVTVVVVCPSRALLQASSPERRTLPETNTTTRPPRRAPSVRPCNIVRQERGAIMGQLVDEIITLLALGDTVTRRNDTLERHLATRHQRFSVSTASPALS